MKRYALFGLVALGLLSAWARDGVDRWIARTELPPLLMETSTEMRDRNGALLRVFPVEDGRTRLAVLLAQVDPVFLDMLVRYEDKRFFRHTGVDALALIRAMTQAIWNGHVVSGGSTLSMQVARLLENSGTGRWAGKLRQMRLAWALERQLSKDDILRLYLTHAPYGGALEGVRAASLAWFGKEPGRLTPPEAAMLVALPQAPEARRPDRYPASAVAARARVLQRLDMPPAAGPVPKRMTGFPRLAPHLTDRVRTSARHLTLDAGLQRQMEQLARRGVVGMARGVSLAVLVADHQSGEILAAVGAPEYADTDGAQGYVDMTRALRSPGSTLKPLIYGLAFDQGLAHPETLIRDAPVSIGTYAPQNFDGQFRGDVTLRSALQQSLNIPPILLLQALGPARLMATLRQGGAAPVVPGGKAGLAVALGGMGLSLHDLVQVYAGVAQGGAGPLLRWDRATESATAGRMMSRRAAWQVSDVLAHVPPPAGSAARMGEIAFKTGTSYGHRDAWAVGYDGRHVVGVWLGRPDGTPVPGAFGGDLAAPLLFEAFGRIAPRRTALLPPPGDTLILSTAALPPNLQRFRVGDRFAFDVDRPKVDFPPDGAVLRRVAGDGLTLKLRSGRLPMTVLIDGLPVVTGLMRRNVMLQVAGPGFTRISVIDALGRSAQVRVRMD